MDTYNLLGGDGGGGVAEPGLSLSSGFSQGVDLLPMSTKVIPEKYSAPQRFWVCACASASVLGLVIFVAIVAHPGKVFVGLALLLALALALGAWYARARGKREYHRLVENDGYMYGIFIFSSGDIVVRLKRRFPFCFSQTQLDFRGSSITHTTGNNLSGYIYIFYNTDAGTQETQKISVGSMTRKPVDIARMIEEATSGENAQGFGLSSI